MVKIVVKTEKCENLLEQVRLCLEKSRYRFSNHALERKQQRAFTLLDILHILKNGRHEKAKDTWDEQRMMWKYSLRGKTIDRDEGRIIVSLDETGMLIITVIRLI